MPKPSGHEPKPAGMSLGKDFRRAFHAASWLFLTAGLAVPAMADSTALQSEIAQVCGAIFTVSQTATGPLTEGVCAEVAWEIRTGR